MTRLHTLRELFDHNDWARDKLLAAAAPFTEEQLDRPFEMGLGSLRNTLHHVWAAERVWLDRWTGVQPPRFPALEKGCPVTTISERFRSTAHERNAWLAAQSDADLDKRLAYTNTKGESFTNAYGDMLLHVYNHGVHHRAQATNMVRRLGGAVPKPGLDYVFMRIERTSDPVPSYDLATIRRYFEYADWVRERVHAAAAELSSDQLDRPFEMGIGTLRKTLLHICAAEQWWYGNWTGAGSGFPELDATMSISDLRHRFDQVAATRNAFIDKQTDADLQRIVQASPRPGVTRMVPLGGSMLQLCCHGTLHRAQALNMLRHVGAKPPVVDLIAFARET